MAESEHNASQQPLAVGSPPSSIAAAASGGPSGGSSPPSAAASSSAPNNSNSSNGSSSATNSVPSAPSSASGGSSSSSNSSSGSSSGPPQNIQQLVASKRLQQAQAQVGEVVDIMRINVEKVLERDSKLSELDRRADDLQEGASQFQQQAVKLKRKLWWENAKMWIILGVLFLFVLALIVLSTTSPGGNGGVHPSGRSQSPPSSSSWGEDRNGTLETVDETGVPGPAFTTLHKIVISTPHPEEEKKQEPPLLGGGTERVESTHRNQSSRLTV